MLACVGFLAAHAATGKVCLAANWVVRRPAFSLFRAGSWTLHAHVSHHATASMKGMYLCTEPGSGTVESE